ncbi:MAG: response regulator [Lachnospiraceae bacterium]|nr:response regulator [Lachnospiraceae bacterium]
MEPKIILVVDDDMTSLKLAKNILEKEYRVATVNAGTLVFKYLMKNTPDLILLDLNMPDMDGFEVMEQIRVHPSYSNIPVIFLTANQDPQSEAKCLETGAIDFVAKPFVPLVLKSRVRRTIELYGYRSQLESMVTQQAHVIGARNERIASIQNAVIIGMANLIESRDMSTGMHVRNTQHYVEMICNALYEQGLYRDILTEEYLNNTIKAAPLHDVGKIKISDTILKKPGKLTEEEFRMMQRHAAYGAEIIDGILGDVEDEEYIRVARAIALSHHERWDGTGYPNGMKGEEIPLCARIMAIADVFDALYEDRVYKKGIRPMCNTMAMIEAERGRHFDPVITDVFMGLTDELLGYVGETEKHSS